MSSTFHMIRPKTCSMEISNEQSKTQLANRNHDGTTKKTAKQQELDSSKLFNRKRNKSSSCLPIILQIPPPPLLENHLHQHLMIIMLDPPLMENSNSALNRFGLEMYWIITIPYMFLGYSGGRGQSNVSLHIFCMFIFHSLI